MNSKFFSAKNVALLGILVALVIVLQLFASAIPMFGVTLNFSLIPIAFAGILLGAFAGAIVGFTSGLVVFISAAVLGGEPFTATLFQAHPVILTLICIGKTTIAGLVSGLVFKFLSKKKEFLAVCVSAVILPIVNTGIYMLGIVLMKDTTATFLGMGVSTAGTVFTTVFAIIWLNFVLEMAVNLIFIPMIQRVVKALKKSN
ncbi:MAG: ECF transporter S component [Clostridiales bacterium]|nr:ECF transporter S component [Clostridiales bacterium]